MFQLVDHSGPHFLPVVNNSGPMQTERLRRTWRTMVCLIMPNGVTPLNGLEPTQMLPPVPRSQDDLEGLSDVY
jgi:hypothetical protein